jgi:cytidine diphosphoramidate kinase
MPNVIWITGLSASGKTTLAKSITKSLKDKGMSVVMLDGDVLRECLDVQKQNSREERKKLAFTYSRLAQMLSLQGVTVVVGTIALFKEIHLWNRENISGYYEIFLNVPIEELRKRDPKGIYKRYFNGEIKDVAGLDISVDYPDNPHLKIDFTRDKTPDVVSKIALDSFNEYNVNG